MTICGAVSLQDHMFPRRRTTAFLSLHGITFHRAEGLANTHDITLGPDMSLDPAWMDVRIKKLEVACYMIQAGQKRRGGFRLKPPAQWHEVSGGKNYEELFQVKSTDLQNQ